MERMPTIFIPHGGGPCFFMDWNPPDTWDVQANYLRGLAASIGQKPKAILVISGHWEEAAFTVQTSAAPDLLFDYNGFPPHTYELTYPAPGDPALASRVADLLQGAGFATKSDPERGYDHGVFIPLKVAFPNADIPVLQLSLRQDLDPAAHIAMGKALQPLRDAGVLIIGSGNTYHNMAVMMRVMRSDRDTTTVDLEFNNWLIDATCHPDPAQRNALLADWATAPGARDAHPREEHLLPLHVVAGAAGIDIGVKTLEDNMSGFSQLAFQFG